MRDAAPGPPAGIPWIFLSAASRKEKAGDRSPASVGC
jgi:hypothetical protein